MKDEVIEAIIEAINHSLRQCTGKKFYVYYGQIIAHVTYLFPRQLNIESKTFHFMTKLVTLGIANSTRHDNHTWEVNTQSFKELVQNEY